MLLRLLAVYSLAAVSVNNRIARAIMGPDKPQFIALDTAETPLYLCAEWISSSSLPQQKPAAEKRKEKIMKTTAAAAAVAVAVAATPKTVTVAADSKTTPLSLPMIRLTLAGGDCVHCGTVDLREQCKCGAIISGKDCRMDG